MNSIPLYFHICSGLWVYFISSIKLNYFLRELGPDRKKGPIIQFWRKGGWGGGGTGRKKTKGEKKKKTLQHAGFWRKKLLIPRALNDGTAIRVAAFFALAASQRKTNKAAQFRNLIRLWVPEQLKYYSWSASVNPPMESIYRWSLLYWWSVTGLFRLFSAATSRPVVYA